MKITKGVLESLLPLARRIAVHAGDVLMAHYTSYNKGADIGIEIKEDNSPVTRADKESHRFILDALRVLTPAIPIISEEDEAHPAVPEDGLFWTVDPLDGTKGFINKSGHFFVKIALLKDFKPVLGVIYQPATQTLFFSIEGGKAFRQQGKDTPFEIATVKAPERGDLKTVFNALHHNPDAYRAAQKMLVERHLPVMARERAHATCSTVFNMAVATGEMDAYLDCGQNVSLKGGNGFSWDYAADALILENAGGVLIDIGTGNPVTFNRPTERMDAMLGLGDRALGETIFPGIKKDCG